MNAIDIAQGLGNCEREELLYFASTGNVVYGASGLWLLLLYNKGLVTKSRDRENWTKWDSVTPLGHEVADILKGMDE